MGIALLGGTMVSCQRFDHKHKKFLVEFDINAGFRCSQVLYISAQKRAK